MGCDLHYILDNNNNNNNNNNDNDNNNDNNNNIKTKLCSGPASQIIFNV